MSPPEKTPKSMTQHYQEATLSLQRLDERARGWPGLLLTAAREALKPETAISAAAIAYFALFSLFPLTLLSISIASFTLGPTMDQNVIIQRFEFIAPALGQLLGQNINEIINDRGPITSLALVGLVWAASTIFYVLTQTLNRIWGYTRTRPIWKQRGLALLLVMAIVGPALILASFFSSMIANFASWLPDKIPLFFSGSISLVVAILLDIALFMLVYIMFPHGVSTWREIYPGAIGAGLLWELAKKGFLFFVSTYFSASNLVYGSVATIIAFLLWAYISGLIFMFGAFLSVALYQRKLTRQRAETQID